MSHRKISLSDPSEEGKEGKQDPGRTPLVTTAPSEPGSSTTPNLDGRSSSDTKVSWIYLLKKDELARQLQAFHLDATGTVEEMRKRLVMFMRVGLPSPQPPSPFLWPIPPIPTLCTPTTAAVTADCTVPTAVNTAPTAVFTAAVPTVTYTVPSYITAAAPAFTAPTVSAAAPKALDPLTIRKWNVHFNGKGDPAAFLERLDEVCDYTNFSHDQLLTVLPELLQDEPLMWYRNNKRYWREWTEFVRDFRTMYFPANYLEDLEAEIGRRLQKANEPANAYLTDMQTLMRRHAGMTPEQEVRWLYRNLLPDYRLYIRKTDFTDLLSLTAKVKEYELLRTELYPVNRAVTATQVPGPMNVGTRPMQTSHLQVPTHPERPPRPPRLPPESQPSSSRPTGNQVTADTAGTAVTAAPRPRVCFRCGEAGHYRAQCNNRPKLFCSYCKKEGIMTKDCNCRRPQGN